MKIIAECDNTIQIEGNHYFPPETINKEYFKESNTHTTCPWKKGIASCYNIEIDGRKNSDAAWYYPEPKDAAKEIKNYVAFGRGVKVVE